MTEPFVVIIGTTPAIALALACMILVTVLAVLDHRRRGHLIERHLSEMDAGRECRALADDWADRITKDHR